MDESAKKSIKLIAIASSIGCAPLLFMFFTLFVVVLFVLGLFDSGTSNGGSNVSYDSSCNFEETKVTVMDGRNTTILATVSLEDYIIGVACIEIGACGGASTSINENYVKAQYVASKTYVLARGGYNSSTKSITIKASTRDQGWCDLKTGCILASDGKYGNYYPGNYDKNKITGTIQGIRSFTEKDLEVFHKYYQDIYGELYLSSSYNDKITSLGSSAMTSYKATTQNFWSTEANRGKDYAAILAATATSGKSNASDYANKSIYKMGNYCQPTTSGSNTSGSSSIAYVQWMINFAADDRHGYSMNNRYNNPDVDCSSFVYYALINNGYSKSQLGSGPFTTSTISEKLISAGFQQIPYDKNSLQEGDIVWYPAGFNGHKYGHTEVYIGNGKTVGAHSNYDGKTGDSSGKEVSVVSLSKPYKSIFRKK